MKRTNNEGLILLMLLSASLPVAFFYSPIGSPDLYNPPCDYPLNQGVNFNSVIHQMASYKPSNQDRRRLESSSGTQYAGGGSGNSVFSDINCDISSNTSVFISSSTRSSLSVFRRDSLSTTKHARTTVRSQKTAFSTISTDLNLVDLAEEVEAFGFQKAANSFDPPPDPPGAPIGDSLSFLLTLGAVYGSWKAKKTQ